MLYRRRERLAKLRTCARNNTPLIIVTYSLSHPPTHKATLTRHKSITHNILSQVISIPSIARPSRAASASNDLSWVGGKGGDTRKSEKGL